MVINGNSDYTLIMSHLKLFCRWILLMVLTSACAHQRSYVGETVAPINLETVNCVKLVIANDWPSLERNISYCKDYQNIEGISPLMMSAYKNQMEIFEKLIAAGSNVALKDKSGSDTLFYAVNFHRVEMVKRLRASGAAIKMNDFNVNALWVALQKSKFELVQALNPTADEVNLTGEDGWTAIYFAIRREETEIFDLIIKAGANPNTKDSEGVSPYNFAKDEVKWSYARRKLASITASQFKK